MIKGSRDTVSLTVIFSLGSHWKVFVYLKNISNSFTTIFIYQSGFKIIIKLKAGIRDYSKNRLAIMVLVE